MSATLAIVATPIGNLKDITIRAIETLSAADYIFAEDTRVIRKILETYEIQKSGSQLITLNEHSTDRDFESLLQKLSQEGVLAALTTDAGTPGVSDPGGRFVAYVRQHQPETVITPIPGVSALTTLLSVSGVYAPEGVIFLGFPPHKKGRQTFIKNVVDHPGSLVVVYESSHRIEKFIAELAEFAPHPEKIRVFVGRELTKMHEELIDTNLVDYSAYMTANPVKTKGEFCVGIYHTK